MSDDILNIDINDLTIAEVVEIEERTGLPLDALGQSDKPKGKKRRDDPDFTWEMAGALKISATTDKVDPTDGDE